MADVYCDFGPGGDDSRNGTSFAQRVRTISRATTLASPGDRIKVMQSGNPTAIGSATWTDLSDTVTLSSAVNANVTTCDSNWTAASNVTCTSASFPIRQGTNCQSIAIASAFTTGKAAYFATGSLDLSSYQQICLWIQANATVSSGVLRIDLCSDTTGDTPVNSFTINTAIATTGSWHPIVIDYGSALSASIQSVALYCISDPGTVTVYLDNIFVATAPSSSDSLTLNSLISKNTGTETWWAIQSINGTTIKLDKCPKNAANTTSKYIGGTETVTTYKREMIQCAITTGNCQSTSANGTSSNYITISGGWDSTDMSTQVGATWLDGQTGQGTGFNIGNNYINLDPFTLGASRFNKGFVFASASANTTGSILGSNNNNANSIEFNSGIFPEFGSIIGSVGNGIHGVYVSNGSILNIDNIYNCHSNIGSGVFLASVGVFSASSITSCNNPYGVNMQSGACTIGQVFARNNSGDGFNSNGSSPVVINNLTSFNNSAYGLEIANTSNHQIFTYSSSGNTTASIRVNTSNKWVEAYINNASITDSSVVSGLVDYKDQRICLQNRNGTLNDNIIYTDGGNITVDTSDPHTIGGLDYTINVTGTTRTSRYPIKFSVAKIAVNAGSLVTASIYLKKSHANNISAMFILPGGRVPGVPNDVSATASSTSYTQYTISFTPSQKCVAELFVYCWSDSGSTTDYCRIADISVTQV